MGRHQDQDIEDYSSESAGVMAVRNMIGGTPWEAAEQIRDDPVMLAEVAAKMSIPPAMLRSMVKRILAGKPEQIVQEAIDNAAEAVKYVNAQAQQDFENQSSATRKALAVSRLESCYATLFSMGVRQDDWRAVKAASTVAVDIARVDGTLRERDSIESELERAASRIEQRKKAQLGHEPNSSIIEAAIVSQPTGVQRGRAESGIDELGGAVVVGGADGF